MYGKKDPLVFNIIKNKSLTYYISLKNSETNDF